MSIRSWRPRVAKRFEPLLFPFLLSGLMTLLITGISVGRVLGLEGVLGEPLTFSRVWLESYLSAWLIAYPVLLIVSPIVRRLVNWLTWDLPEGQ